MSGEGENRRLHARYQCSLEVDISVCGRGEVKLIESTRLKNISGGGAQFASTCIAHYSIGYVLLLCIHLPDDASKEDEIIECEAHVVWVDDQGESSDPSVSIAMNYVFDATQIKSLTSYSGTPE